MFCVFLTRSWSKRETIVFPSNICTKNYFLKKHKQSWKNSRNFQEKTQENIQKLKQNEHQVLSCTQKKCKINTPAIPTYLCSPKAQLFFWTTTDAGSDQISSNQMIILRYFLPSWKSSMVKLTVSYNWQISDFSRLLVDHLALSP